MRKLPQTQPLAQSESGFMGIQLPLGSWTQKVSGTPTQSYPLFHSLYFSGGLTSAQRYLRNDLAAPLDRILYKGLVLRNPVICISGVINSISDEEKFQVTVYLRLYGEERSNSGNEAEILLGTSGVITETGRGEFFSEIQMASPIISWSENSTSISSLTLKLEVSISSPASASLPDDGTSLTAILLPGSGFSQLVAARSLGVFSS